jgi:hypothetical protein
MIARDPSPFGRLVDVWHGGTDRDPKCVVAEYRERAPAWLRRQVRPLTTAERELWRYLGDRSWMRADVFTQVPVHVPEANRGFVFGFFVPSRAVAIEVMPGRFEDSIDRIVRTMEQDDLVRDRAGIATLRCFEAMALRDARVTAESIRWDLGFGEKGDDDHHGINLPRR